MSWSIGATIYTYLKCIVYDKLIKPRQSFLITLYLNTSLTSADTNCKLPEDGVRTPKHVAEILILILYYL